MGRNNTKAVKNITKMYEQLGLAQDDIFHKTKLLLSIYRDVVWATLADCNCVNEEIYYYGDDLTDALVYLEEFAPDVERSEFERRVCNLFENKWMIDLKALHPAMPPVLFRAARLSALPAAPPDRLQTNCGCFAPSGSVCDLEHRFFHLIAALRLNGRLMRLLHHKHCEPALSQYQRGAGGSVP